MNAVVVSDQPVRRVPDVVRHIVRRGTRVGHYCSSAIGFVAIVGALALWFQPAWRAAIIERIMPMMASGPSDDASAVNFLASTMTSGTPHPVLAALNGLPASASKADTMALGASAPSLGAFGAPLDPSNLPSVVRLAQPLRIVADARYGMSGTSARNQQNVASYIARRYRVAQEPIDTLVHAAFQTGRDVGLDPTLLLAVMAVESGFNPYAESGAGARGLMQVMPTVHSDKFDYYGGPEAALEPVPNLRVGALILKTYIGQTGSIAGGLRRYVGATTPGDGGYGARVLAERARLRDALQHGADKALLPTAVVASAKPAVKTPTAPASQKASASAEVAQAGAVHNTASTPAVDGTAKAAVAVQHGATVNGATAPPVNNA